MFKNYNQQRLFDITDGLDLIFKKKSKKKPKNLCFMEYEDVLKANRKKYGELRLKNLIFQMETLLKNFKGTIEEYKKIKNHTEFFESKETYNFNFEDWFTIRKVNGHITRYYNELLEVYNKIRRNNEK